MIQLSDKENLTIIYLDQFAVSGIFESDLKLWLKIKELILAGVNKKRIICPVSNEHFLETSQKEDKKAKKLDENLYNISGGYGFKNQFFITSQLIISYIRKNNLTLKTFMYDNCVKNVLSNESNLDLFRKEKDAFNTIISNCTKSTNDIRKVTRTKSIKDGNMDKMYNACIAIEVNRFRTRLIDLKNNKEIRLRGFRTEFNEIANWEDQLLFQFNNRHKMNPNELNKIIKELEINGFKNIPTLDIRFSLEAFIALHHKNEISNDQIDINRISTALPISDILFTDKQRKHEILTLELDKKYNSKVFCGCEKDLEEVITILEDIVMK